MIKTKCIYDPASVGDGLRVLVTRYWPRGIKKEKCDRWLKELAPAPSLIKLWKSGAISWDEFKKKYLDEYASQAKLALLKELETLNKAAKGVDLTLLCMCRDEVRCHRAVLKDLLEKKISI
ncbi:MAG: DUF488 domain-containing protein [Thermodesulfobacteriota bacterium]